MPEAAARRARSRPPLWRDVRVLRFLLQVLVVGIIVVVVLYLFNNLTTNLARTGARRDFSYLRRSAGFAIADSDFRSSQPVWRALVVGIQNTAAVAVIGIVLASILGVTAGVARLSRNWLVRKAAAFYVESIRNIPVVVIIVFIFIAVILKLPQLSNAREFFGWFVLSNETGITVPSLSRTGPALSFGIGLTMTAVAVIVVWVWRTRRFDVAGRPHHRVLWGLGVAAIGIAVAYLASGQPLVMSLPRRAGRGFVGGISMPASFTALLAGLVIYTASHIAEITRGSILAVSRGQSEAAHAIGLSEFQRYRYVVLPQAFRIMVPPVANQYLNLTKNSSLAVFVAYPEVVRITDTIISQGGPAPQGILILMAIYLMFSLTISLITNLVNRRLQLATR